MLIYGMCCIRTTVSGLPLTQKLCPKVSDRMVRRRFTAKAALIFAYPIVDSGKIPPKTTVC